MLEYFLQYGLFLAKAVTIVVAIGVVIGFLFNAFRHAREFATEHLEVKNLNRRFENMAEVLYHELQSAPERKAHIKAKKTEYKQRAKAAKLGKAPRPRVFVLGFDGDIRASAVENLREEISAVVQVARPGDEVLLRLESSGGMVHTYGLAASQLKRLRSAGIRLTAAVDEVAASGGYMMACVADRIIAAPFAVIGSIGVVAQLPNFNRLLKQHHVDFELHTAGEYKRTLTLFGENTEAAREKFREELEDTHALFKSFVTDNRPQLDMQQVATGEHWYGSRAIERKLVDAIQTSDDYLLAASKDKDLFEVKYKRRQGLPERLAHSIRSAMNAFAGAYGQDQRLPRGLAQSVSTPPDIQV
ncbi:MAG: protease SohB [Nevskiales bacterium]